MTHNIRAMPSARSGALRAEPDKLSRAKPPAAIAGHTPGPWNLAKHRDGTMVVLKRDANGNPHKHIAEMVWADSEGGEPDARLITVAPEMLAAMQEFVDRVEAGEVRSKRTYAKFKALIAKAQGEPK